MVLPPLGQVRHIGEEQITPHLPSVKQGIHIRPLPLVPVQNLPNERLHSLHHLPHRRHGAGGEDGLKPSAYLPLVQVEGMLEPILPQILDLYASAAGDVSLAHRAEEGDRQ